MHLADLIAEVGEAEFHAACRAAWRTGAGTGAPGSPGDSPPELHDPPHDLADPIWFEGEQPMLERLRLAQELYRAMPCYANLMYFPFDAFGRSKRYGQSSPSRSVSRADGPRHGGVAFPSERHVNR